MTLTTNESHYITTNIGEIIDTMDATIDPNIVDVINNPNTANGAYAGIHLIYITYAEVYGNRIIDGNGYSGSAILADTGCGYNDFIGNMAKGMTGTKFSFAGSNNTDDNNISR